MCSYGVDTSDSVIKFNWIQDTNGTLKAEGTESGKGSMSSFLSKTDWGGQEISAFGLTLRRRRLEGYLSSFLPGCGLTGQGRGQVRARHLSTYKKAESGRQASKETDQKADSAWSLSLWQRWTDDSTNTEWKARAYILWQQVNLDWIIEWLRGLSPTCQPHPCKVTHEH